MEGTNFVSPLGGAVTQSWAFNPFMQMANGWFQQMGFININVQSSTNRSMEEKITQEVAGYGQQLGWLLEALVVVIDRVKKPQGFSEDEEKKIMRIKNLFDDISSIRKGYQSA